MAKSKLILPWLLAINCLTGCSTFYTEQHDLSYIDEAGNEVRYIQTRVKAATRFESHSSLSNFKALNTDKTQSTQVGSLNQESTNAVNMVEAVSRGATKAILKQ